MVLRIDVEIARPGRGARWRAVSHVLVDSGSEMSWLPAALSLTTAASTLPPSVASSASAVVGKFAEVVSLTQTNAAPEASTIGEALQIEVKVLGRDHPYLVPVLFGLGSSHRNLGAMEVARARFDEAWAISHNQPTAQEVQVPRSFLYLARAVAETGDLEAGWRLYGQAHVPFATAGM